MHREDNSNYLLFIEPLAINKAKEPLNDKIVKLMEIALENSVPGISSYSNLDDRGFFREDSMYKGFHITDCGENAGNQDYLLKNGMITNKLASYYLKWYRNFIPVSEMNKIHKLLLFYSDKINIAEITDHEKCPDCGGKIKEKMSGVECTECDYWFCF